VNRAPTCKKKLYDAIINGTADERIARDAADRAKTAADKATDVASKAALDAEKSAALVNAAAKSSLTTDQVQQAANKALADYVASPAFGTNVSDTVKALTTSPKITLEENVDRPGGPGTSVLNVADPQACQRLCLEDAKCLAYTFVPKNAAYGHAQGLPTTICSLKASQPAAEFTPTLFSGVRRLN
jgi:PAN domain